MPMAHPTRRDLAAAAIAGLAGLAAPTILRAQPMVLRFSHVVAPDTPKGRGALRFAELAARYSDGAVTVQIYPNSTLYKDKEELEALQLGAVQVLAPSLAKFGPLGLSEFEMFDLPYIFSGEADLRRITEGEIGTDLLAKLDTKGIRGLAFWDNGFKLISANRPLHRPGDCRGLKMRIQSSRIIEAQMAALGAVPQITGFSEAYQALATGFADGTENPPSNMYTQRMHEVQRHATLSHHGYLGYALIVNATFWDGLPAALRDGLDRAVAEATAYANSTAAEDNAAALAAMRAAGTTQFHDPTPEERAEWLAVLRPVQDQMAGRVGERLLGRVRDLLGQG
ncbi:DctP family TRAP transporter solute-binding subunit [Frigidibacter oleivorans]|uniref:DctP family TRAP transporter solute-binding subunit n=1 Tax=Frigidibacter oleivorans TaxID=2487129 RepID=UPI001F31AE90|nr:DctP family TRAP transporter solute-binding subunit [Frigidibacter oleivorans]